MGPDDWTPTMGALQGQFVHDHPFDTATIRLGRRRLDVHVARTPAQWARGMAGQADIEALLFVMPPGSQYPFHMKDVDHDLLIAFFDEVGRVVDIGYLHAQVGFKHAATPYAYALEIKLEADSLEVLGDIADGLTVE